ncbi:SRPBCC family protein [Xanthomarina sp. F1114]|uniref:SRPBCC family protein n=1 Tax=Xanthomarina sp. F1114 TaxID=2996019 RepID=UPI00225DD9C3|nr:GyrI-like domain-containing protein [Xanthomarina sp. F1114]MCX7547085.1 SRPBCC family protein [Xanthomarina sp. F1114]
MKAIKYILFLILIFIIGLTIYVAVQPNSFDVKRTKTMEASNEIIYNNVIDFKNWEAWSPWIEKAPETVVTLGDKTSGIASSYAWVNDDGPGQMKTTKTTSNSSIDQILQFGDFQSTDVHWDFNPKNKNKTEVSWKISSDNIPFKLKAYAIFTGGFDEMIGPDIEKGLEKLDSVIQASMKVYSIKVDNITQRGGGFYLYKTTSAKMNNFDSVKQAMLSEVESYVNKNNITTAGPPFVLYHKWDEDNNAVMFSSCVPTTNQVISLESEILTGQLEPFRALKTTLKGNSNNLKEAWDTAMNYIPENNLQLSDQGPMLEVHVTDPTKTPNPANWITEIYLALDQ